MRTVIFLPPLKKSAGGIANLLLLARSLAAQGRDAALTCPAPGVIAEELPVPCLAWDTEGAFLRPKDILIVPEGWPNAIPVGIRRKARTVVYVQNWNFMLGTLPEGVGWERLPVEFLAVSQPVAWFLKNILGLSVAGTVPAAIDPLFRPGERRRTQDIRIAWMPRKNKGLATQVQRIAAELLARQGHLRATFVPIQDMPLEGVASALAGCSIFLSSGFPEGFALPPLEAMACRCVPVGFSGLGGFEYMRNPNPQPPGCWTPPFPLADVPWAAGNGLFAADGDVLGAGMLLAQAARWAAEGTGQWEELMANGELAASAYGQDRMAAAVADFWDRLETGAGAALAAGRM